MGIDIKFRKHFVLKILSYIAFSLLLVSSSLVNASEGDMLAKVYHLDNTMSSEICPGDLKKVRRATNKDFNCNKMKIKYGYPSLQVSQCETRKAEANEIIHEYNIFIDRCKNEQQ